MSFDVNVYDQALADLVAGNFNAATPLDAMLVQSSYVFTNAHVYTDCTALEIAGGSYARYTGGNFTVAAVNDEIQYTVITPPISFSSFSAADWRYIIIFNSTSHNIYLCIDTGVTNTQVSSGFTLDPGSDPFIRVLSP